MNALPVEVAADLRMERAELWLLKDDIHRGRDPAHAIAARYGPPTTQPPSREETP